jgi:hypothetical protein
MTSKRKLASDGERHDISHHDEAHRREPVMNNVETAMLLFVHDRAGLMPNTANRKPKMPAFK